MKTDKPLISGNRRLRSLILAGLTALTLVAPALRAQTPLSDTAPPPSQEGVDKRPDLSIQMVQILIYAGGSSYDKTRAFVFVQNQGLTKSQPCTLTLQSSGDLGSAQSSAAVPGLKPGTVIGVTINTPIGVAEPGTIHHFEVDAYNVVDERDEFNNTYD